MKLINVIVLFFFLVSCSHFNYQSSFTEPLPFDKATKIDLKKPSFDPYPNKKEGLVISEEDASNYYSLKVSYDELFDKYNLGVDYMKKDRDFAMSVEEAYQKKLYEKEKWGFLYTWSFPIVAVLGIFVGAWAAGR
jgi:hypothetical protein